MITFVYFLFSERSKQENPFHLSSFRNFHFEFFFHRTVTNNEEYGILNSRKSYDKLVEIFPFYKTTNGNVYPFSRNSPFIFPIFRINGFVFEWIERVVNRRNLLLVYSKSYEQALEVITRRDYFQRGVQYKFFKSFHHFQVPFLWLNYIAIQKVLRKSPVLGLFPTEKSHYLRNKLFMEKQICKIRRYSSTEIILKIDCVRPFSMLQNRKEIFKVIPEKKIRSPDSYHLKTQGIESLIKWNVGIRYNGNVDSIP